VSVVKLGDIPDGNIDRIEMYFRIMRQGTKLQRKKWIKSPDWDGCPSPELAKAIPGLQEWFECHVIPRLWQLKADGVQYGSGVPQIVQPPSYLSPPPTARLNDLRNEGAVNVAAVTETTVITYTVPDRCVAVVTALGNACCETSDWDRLRWNVKVNQRPEPSLGEFRNQHGSVSNPTALGKPILLKHGDVFLVSCRLSAAGAAADVWARAQIYVYPARDISQAGDYAQLHLKD